MLPVLFEGRGKRGLLHGLTDNYIRVMAAGPESAQEHVRNVRLDRIEEDGVMGTLEGYEGVVVPDGELLQVVCVSH